MKNQLKATIDRIEEDKAVLIFDDGQKLIVPINKLPANSTAGKVLELNLIANEDVTEEKENLAKDVLNEILSGE
ncbi:DUF3006 domain-containing protein [Candidatus Kuenenbacteria bacterium]|nr:DUF3006 domain-containing protein [Candidatus Kuenenbacteria bacterium]